MMVTDRRTLLLAVLAGAASFASGWAAEPIRVIAHGRPAWGRNAVAGNHVGLDRVLAARGHTVAVGEVSPAWYVDHVRRVASRGKC